MVSRINTEKPKSTFSTSQLPHSAIPRQKKALIDTKPESANHTDYEDVGLGPSTT